MNIIEWKIKLSNIVFKKREMKKKACIYQKCILSLNQNEKIEITF